MTSSLPLWVSDAFFLLGVACLVCSLLIVACTAWCCHRDARDQRYWDRVHAGWSSGLDPEQQA
jgi:hypothetical protein